MRFWLSALASVALSACSLAQADRIHYVWTPEAAAAAAPASALPPSQETFVGLALSGGGSRAATFSAAAMEALHEHGLLTQTTHISSVSGGGFAAAWYALNRPDLCATTTGDAACTAKAFAQFGEAMRHDFLLDVTGRQLLKPNRISSPTRRLSSLADALDGAFIGGATFADVPASPVLLVNAARLDDGRRFVFSNTVIPDDAMGLAPLQDPRLRSASFSLPGCPRATPGAFSLSLAIATSAAFPVYLGPATIHAARDCAGTDDVYWHLADGGVIENLGVETLEEMALRSLDGATPPARVLLLSIDGEATSDPEASFADENLSIWTSDPARIVDVAMARGRAYHDLVWNDVLETSSAPFELVSVRYTDALLDAWPASCADLAGDGEDVSAAISLQIAAVATSLRISDCDADLMEEAAHQLVHEAINARLDSLVDQGFALSPVEPHGIVDERSR